MFARVLLLLLLLLFGPVIPPQKQNSQVDISKKNISSAIGLSREGLLGKACQALVSPGVVPNTPEVWDLLRQKHPRGPHPSLPISSSPPVNHVLPHDSIQEHWKDDNITVCKVDMSNAFNLVSRQALLEECAVHFTELLPWVGWCYGSHPTLWHPLGQLSSETGVQQGDPLGPLSLFLSSAQVGVIHRTGQGLSISIVQQMVP